MSPLRRVPQRPQPNDNRPIFHYPLGLVRIDRGGIDGLARLLRTSGRSTVKIYVGDDISPRRIKSAEEAKDRELKQAKVVLDKPKITVRLSRRGAFISSTSTTVNAKRIIADATAYMGEYKSPLFRFEHYFYLLAALALWGLCLIGLNRIDNLWVTASMSVLLMPALVAASGYMVYLFFQSGKKGMAYVNRKPVSPRSPKVRLYSRTIFTVSLSVFFCVIAGSILILNAIIDHR